MKKNKIKKTPLIVLTILAILIMGAGIFGVNYYNSQLEAVSTSSDKQLFTVEEGMLASDVLNALEESELIQNASMARIYVKLNDDANFKAGDYAIDKMWDTPEILSYISNASNAMTNEVMITLKEGLWAKNMAAEFEKFTNVTAQELINCWNDEDFLYELLNTYEFLDESIFNSEYPVKLEGYLLPNTYAFYRETTPQEITYRLMEEFDRFYQNNRQLFDNSSRSIHENVIFASVIQFESGSLEEMPIIAGVFENRMNDGMMLQASATVCYGIYEIESIWDCESNPEYPSAYNTYIHTGLPVGPISNPGETALLAALQPAETSYYYFVHDVNGDGKAYFAETYEEHLVNVDKYLY